jgi:hypothetical protein
MRRRWSIVVGALLFAVGAIGIAVWLWVKRRQVESAAAKGEAEAASSAAATEQASAEATEQASATADAIPEQAPSAK